MAAITPIKIRRGTAAQWTSANPILALGEMGLETDSLTFKFGDGTSTWTALPYANITDISGKSDVGHTHTSSQITDSTATGRSVLTAASAAAARTAIGAGTSDLVIGTGAGNAKAGNWVPSFSEVTGTISTAQLPPIAIQDTFVVASQAAMLALTAQRGDVAIRTDTTETYILSSESPSTLADWKEMISHGNVTTVAGRTGAVVLTKTDVGLSAVDNTSDASKPVSTATQTALNAKENSLPAGGNTTHYLRGDKTWQVNDKASVGLGNVDNTSDANKPVSTATNTALGLKANAANPTFTGTVTGVTKAHVGLSNVDNTADSAKPVSTAQQTALNAKANLSHTHSSADILVIDGGTP